MTEAGYPPQPKLKAPGAFIHAKGGGVNRWIDAGLCFVSLLGGQALQRQSMAGCSIIHSFLPSFTPSISILAPKQYAMKTYMSPKLGTDKVCTTRMSLSPLPYV